MTVSAFLPETQFADVLGLFQNLKNQAVRANKRKNLDLLWEVLVQMWQEGALNYGLAEVGRRLMDAGGPKTQSLRNEGGKDFRRLIDAFSVCAGGNDRAYLAKGRSQLDLAVESLGDPAMRALFRQIVAENKLYKTQNDQLRSTFKQLSVKRPSEHPGSEPSGGNGGVIPEPHLTVQEKDVLRRSLSQERFDENGWVRLEEGSVIDDTGVTVLSAGFMQIIGKLLGDGPL